MAERPTRDGEGAEAQARRPLWRLGLAAHFTATTVAWLALLAWIEYDNARLDEGHVFEADDVVRPPAAFTSDWWANAASAFPRIALVALAYALPLVAIVAFLERRRPRSGTVCPLAGAAAMVPLGCVYLVLLVGSPQVVEPVHFVPLLVLAAIGAAGAAAAAAACRGLRS